MTCLDGIREFNRRLNDYFFPRSQRRYVGRYRELARSLSRDADLVVDLGAGRFDLERDLEFGGPKPLLIALDKSLKAFKENPSNLKVAGEAEALPLLSASVDLVVSEQVFEHLPCPLVCLEECFRVLRPGGKLLISGPNGWSYIALMARLSPLDLHRFVQRLASDSNGVAGECFPTFYRFNAPRTMRRLARRVGFDVIDIETFVGEPCYTTFIPLLHLGSIAYHLVLEKLRPIFGFHITSVALFGKPLRKN